MLSSCSRRSSVEQGRRSGTDSNPDLAHSEHLAGSSQDRGRLADDSAAIARGPRQAHYNSIQTMLDHCLSCREVIDEVSGDGASFWA
jgi:hypothetical protein